MSVSKEKAALRRAYTQYRRSLSGDEKAAMDTAVANQVLQTDAYLSAETVFCYASLPSEIDTYAILSDAWQRKKRVALPRCKKDGVMEFYSVSSINDLSCGMLGIPEPDPTCSLCIPSSKDVCIVPCLAVDTNGFRLGYGGGYYDRYLSLNPVKTIGLCYSACRTERLPTDSFDIPIQLVITEKEV